MSLSYDKKREFIYDGSYIFFFFFIEFFWKILNVIRKQKNNKRINNKSHLPLASHCRKARGTWACAPSAKCRQGWLSYCAGGRETRGDVENEIQRADVWVCCPQRRASSNCVPKMATHRPMMSARSSWSAAIQVDSSLWKIIIIFFFLIYIYVY